MQQNKIAIVVGTRPEIIKMQPIIKEIEARSELDLLFIHTGQHYGWHLSNQIIDELQLPKPDIYLNVGSGSQGAQIARIIFRAERVLKKIRPYLVLVEGDTNSALGAALAASRLKIPIGHVEAGCRSFDKNMLEEINRVLIADLALLHFAPTETCVKNLLNEGILKEKIYLVGHPIVDVVYSFKEKISKKRLSKLGLTANKYYFVTLHRRENIEHKEVLSEILKNIQYLSEFREVLFSIHPHTEKMVKKFGLEKCLKRLKVTKPLGYLDTLTLINFARTVLTDSGGIQQEAAILGTPCITLRKTTEWIETVKLGINFLTGNENELKNALERIENNYNEITRLAAKAQKIFGSPPISSKIIDIIIKFLAPYG